MAETNKVVLYVSTATASNGTKTGKILVEGPSGKKIKLLFGAGKDNKWGNDDDKMLISAENGFFGVSRAAVNEGLSLIRKGNIDGVVKIEQKSTNDLFDVNELENNRKTEALLKSGDATKNLEALGFTSQEASFILETLKNRDVPKDIKNAIKEKISTIEQQRDVEDQSEEIKEVYRLAFKYTPANSDEVKAINSYMYSELSRLCTNDEKKDFDPAFTNKLTPHNIMDVWMTFGYKNIDHPAAALEDDFNNTPDILSPAYHKMLDCIKERAKILGITLNAEKLETAEAWCAQLTEHDADNDAVENAAKALHQLIWDLKWWEERT